MRAYLAARYSRRLELVDYAEQLSKLGHSIVSGWITGKHELSSQHGAQADQDAGDAEKVGWAREDIDDLMQADTVICFTEPPGDRPGRNRGGRHVELGWVLGYNAASLYDEKRIVVVGPAENIFYLLPEVERYETWGAFLATVAGRATDA